MLRHAEDLEYTRSEWRYCTRRFARKTVLASTACWCRGRVPGLLCVMHSFLRDPILPRASGRWHFCSRNPVDTGNLVESPGSQFNRIANEQGVGRYALLCAAIFVQLLPAVPSHHLDSDPFAIVGPLADGTLRGNHAEERGVCVDVPSRCVVSADRRHRAVRVYNTSRSSPERASQNPRALATRVSLRLSYSCNLAISGVRILRFHPERNSRRRRKSNSLTGP
mmetsp:Transcript_32890/g.80021  ORF Transcript_32890/g.80021 Transcript_32890/m.80021 type:complete len:223 (-) Transcript_32890:7969-8637(-)